MKKIQLSIAALALLFAASCGEPNSDKVEATDAQKVDTPATTSATYTVDNANTKIDWKGSKAVGEGHIGTIALASGSVVNVENGKVTGGKFIFDLNSLAPTDQDAEGNGKLKGHLLADDFLSVEKFPEAYFVITTVTEGAPADSKLPNATHTVTGNLTLKGVEKSITFPAIITVDDAKVTTQADFFIDRTQWGVSYGSDESLGDKFIKKEIELKLNLTATK